MTQLSAEPPIVVAHPGQELPHGDYQRVDDRITDCGPLAGMAAGLKACAERYSSARIAVTGCDYPFAEAVLFETLAHMTPAAAVVLPRWRGRTHPLHAIWSADLWVECHRSVAAGQLAVQSLVQNTSHHVVDATEIDALADPDRALLNLNDRADLKRARASS